MTEIWEIFLRILSDIGALLIRESTHDTEVKYWILVAYVGWPLVLSALHLLTHLQDLAVPLMLDGCQKNIVKEAAKKADRKFAELEKQIK